MVAKLSKVIGPGYRFARPVDPDRVRYAFNQLRVRDNAAQILSEMGVPAAAESWHPYLDDNGCLILFSPDEYKLKSKPQSSNPFMRIKLEIASFRGEIRIHTNFEGVKGGVNVPVRTPQFIEDLATKRKFVLDVARALMGGAEPYAILFTGSKFIFSGSPSTSYRDLLKRYYRLAPGRFPLDPSQYREEREDQSKTFLFYPIGGKDKEIKELPILDAWIINRLLTQRSIFDPAIIAAEAGICQATLLRKIARIQEVRASWGLPALTVC